MTINPKTRSALLAAAALGLTACALPGGHTVVGTPEAVAKTQAQTAGADQARGIVPNNPSLGTNAMAPVNWARMRYTSTRWPGRGWSVAEDRRRAKKARNVRRNRRAQRGAR